MPGWHAKTKDLVADRKLIVLGIAPEQHGDRMALFLQWKQIEDMPVMLDSYNLLGLRAVPITLLLDESGVIRHRNPAPPQLAEFLEAAPAEVGTAPTAPRPMPRVPARWALSNKPADLARAVAQYSERVASGTTRLTHADLHFQRGVALRKLYDHSGPEADPLHFREAVEAWRTALAMDPGNYIFRRRLQQYGPRLDKPYPFYDWIETARREIRARGEDPHPLVAEPTGAEIAQPLDEDAAAESVDDLPHPDPEGNLPRDTTNVVNCTALVVPHTTEPEKAVRVFVTLTPNPVRKAKWNDEAGVSTIRLSPPDGWSSSQAVVALPPDDDNRDLGARTVEFELRPTGRTAPNEDAHRIEFQLFYNVCHGDEAVCTFLRRDVTVDFPAELAPPVRVP